MCGHHIMLFMMYQVWYFEVYGLLSQH